MEFINIISKKMVRPCLLYLLLLSFCVNISAQSNTWDTYSQSADLFTFELPGEVFSLDSLGVEFFNTNADSAIGLQVHYLDSAALDPNERYLGLLLDDSNTRTLDVIVKTVLFFTNGELLSLQNITQKNGAVKGVEIGIKFQENNGKDYVTFYQFYYWDEHFLTLSATALIEDVIKLNSQKQVFFNSLKFN